MWRSTRPALRKLAVGLAAAIALSAVVFRVGLGLAPVDAVYFLLATVTTTGYGDINLLNAPAALKLYGCLVMVLGSAAMATLTSMLTEFLVTSRLAELIGRRRAPREGHVVVAGLGNLGFRVVEELRRHGVPFVAVERDADAPFARSLGADAPVVTGDARFAESLERAGAAGATAVIAATGDDAANLGIALAARRVNPEVRTVVRLFDPDFAEKARAGLPLDAALSASRMAAPLFAAAALDEGVKAAFEADGVLLVVREVAVERAAAEPASRVLVRSEGKVRLVSERELSAPPGPSGATPRA
jgi:Trk K+ transport system NAD-binding subunit